MARITIKLSGAGPLRATHIDIEDAAAAAEAFETVIEAIESALAEPPDDVQLVDADED